MKRWNIYWVNNETEILRLKDAIHDCNQRIKALDMELDEKSFKHRCIPQKRKDTKSMTLKCSIPLAIITIIVIVSLNRAISCLGIIFKIGGANGAGFGIELLIFLIAGFLGIWAGIKLWIYVLRKVELIRDLNISEKRLESELRSLYGYKEACQKEKEEYESKLREEEKEHYLREMSPETELNIENLRIYLDARLGKKKGIEQRVAAPEVINELWRFGYRTIGDIDAALTETSPEYYIPYDTTNYAGILRNLMIIQDCHKYFAEAYRGGWIQTTYERVKFWKDKGIGVIETYLLENGIEVK